MRYGRVASKIFQTRCVCDWSFDKVDIVTGRHLFPENKRKECGLPFRVSYVDRSSPGGKGDAPVVLMLHGAPGNNADFGPQVQTLTDAGARVIAPNFPDLPTMLKYKTPKFRNTPVNKAEFIKDFLREIEVKHVDMMVSHSSGTYTGLRLFHSPDDLTIRSLAFINPLGHWHTCTRPGWFFTPLGEMVNYRLGYAFLQLVGMKFLPLISPVSVPNINDPMIGLTAIRSFDMKEVTEGLKTVAAKKPPLLFFFSENDRLLKKRVSYEMLDILGSKKKDWWLYDPKGQLIKPGDSEDWIRVVSFEAGSHYSLRKHSDLVNEHLVVHLQRFLSEEQSDLGHRGLVKNLTNNDNQIPPYGLPVAA